MVGFWFYMLIMTLLLPAIMLLVGKRFMNRPPKKINAVFGYRTARSMRNPETWDFAHRCCGRFWWRVGWFVMAGTVLAMACVFNREIGIVSSVGTVVVFVQMIPMIMVLPVTERALSREFDSFGRRIVR